MYAHDMTRKFALLLLAVRLAQVGWSRAAAAGVERCEQGIERAGMMACCCEPSPSCICKAAPDREAMPPPFSPRAEDFSFVATVVQELRGGVLYGAGSWPQRRAVAAAGPVPKVVLFCTFRI